MSNQDSEKGDPAARLAEMLAQSLDELARPAPERPAKIAEPPATAPAVIAVVPAKGEEPKLPKTGPAPELEAWFEQFQKKVQSEPAVPLPKAPEPPKATPAAESSEAQTLEGRVLNGVPPSPPPPSPDNDDDILEPVTAVAAATAPVAPATVAAEPPLDPAAANIVRKVRRLMVVSMLITFIGVGSVFGIIGYRIYKNDGAGGKLFDPTPVAPAAATVTPPASAAPVEKTLKLPPNARIVSAGVAENRLVLTLDVGGKIEVRTYDPRTLEPAARLGFSATP